MKCCIYTRLYNENPYLPFFLEYYINLGFDKFILLKADDQYYNIDKKYNDYINLISIQNLPNEQELELNSFYLSDLNYDWVLGCDIDEFLILNKKYKTIKDFIKDKLKINKNINTFYFRWGQIYKLDNEVCKFEDILYNYILFKSKNIKSMVKISTMIAMSHPHHFTLNEKTVIYFENKINLFTNIIQEEDIENSYKEVFLLHINIRSINNLFIKYLDNGKQWQIENYYNFQSNKFNNFISKSGKILLSMEHLISNTGNRGNDILNKDLRLVINLDKFSINKNIYISNFSEEKELLYNLIYKYNINKTDFYLFLYTILNFTNKNKNYFKK